MKIMKEHHKDLASKANIFTKYYFHLLNFLKKNKIYPLNLFALTKGKKKKNFS